MNEKKLSEFWNHRVEKQYKHYLGTEFDKKHEKYVDDLTNNFFNHIDFSDIDIALDWGCGGGVGSSLLANHGEVVCLDISEQSLTSCRNLLEKNGQKIKSEILLNNLTDFSIDFEIDLIFCASVVQHFPSLEYWNSVVEHWRKINPEWIAIQTRHGEENKDNEEEYFQDTKNYILALYLTSEEVLGKFSDHYELKYHKLNDDKYSMYEYFVFKKKH